MFVLRAVGVGETFPTFFLAQAFSGPLHQQIDMRLVVLSGAAMQLVVEGAMSMKLRRPGPLQ